MIWGFIWIFIWDFHMGFHMGFEMGFLIGVSYVGVEKNLVSYMLGAPGPKIFERPMCSPF